jgi:hypothetical protein
MHHFHYVFSFAPVAKLRLAISSVIVPQAAKGSQSHIGIG